MKALLGAFNQEKALVGAFSVIVNPVVKPMDRFTALMGIYFTSGPELNFCSISVFPAGILQPPFYHKETLLELFANNWQHFCFLFLFLLCM